MSPAVSLNKETRPRAITGLGSRRCVSADSEATLREDSSIGLKHAHTRLLKAQSITPGRTVLRQNCLARLSGTLPVRNLAGQLGPRLTRRATSAPDRSLQPKLHTTDKSRKPPFRKREPPLPDARRACIPSLSLGMWNFGALRDLHFEF